MVTPKGKNSLSTKRLFDERGVYEDSYPTDNNVNPIDLWYDHKILYGRVDLCGNPIFLDEEHLVEMMDGIFVVDLVEEAYRDVQTAIVKSDLLGQIDMDNSTILPLKPVRTWKSVHQDYHSHLETIYQIFIGGFISSGVDREIVNYSTFEKQFFSFYKMIRDSLVFTRSSFITSREATPLMSGLMIEFSDADHGDDQAKYTSYIKDKEFDYYRNTMKRHGFVIDKHAPWRVMVDLDSEPIKEKISNKGFTTTNDFFKAYYITAHHRDIETIAGYMHKMYDNFIASYPVVTKPGLSHHGPGIVSETIQRRRVPLNQFLHIYGEKHWVKFYIKIRNMEAKKDFPDRQIKLITKNALDVLKYKGINGSMDYVQQVFGGFSDQITATKPLTEQEVAATMQSVQNQVTQTSGY